MAIASNVTNVDTSNPLAKYQAGAANSSSNSSTSNSADAALSKLTNDYTTFLKLLTTQLQNQDPTSPMDSSQFTQQLVQFSQVEQQIKANQKLDSIVKGQNTNGVSAMLGYIGKSVETSGGSFTVKSGQDSQFTYTLPDTATTLNISVLDKDGTVVSTQTGSKTLGKHLIAWDGKDLNGHQVNDGTYTVRVEAKDNAGNDLTVKTTGFGIVSGIESTSNGTMLDVGTQKFSADSVLAVKEPTAAASS